MFLGTYEPKLDDKGRVILPARFREDMEGGIVLTRGQEHCIYAFPAQEFEQMTAWNDYLSVQEDVFSQTENEIIPGMF